MTKLREFNSEVLYVEEPIVSISEQDIELLKARAARSPRKRCRICTHLAPDDLLHEMLIVHMKDCYVRPHRHHGRAESFSILEGEVDVVLFDEHGGVKQPIKMGEKDSGKAFYYRLSEPIYHTLLIRSEYLVFQEVTTGPFDPASSEFAAWAPEDKDAAAVKTYLSDLEKRLK